ncbi:unnamed protein product [Taenia asiatica]|uniref:DUF1740-domain-containing protein n=1 Tax=Taenia asiatica TaxID=60517 RepID=A0A0R3W0L9_TAEAS|nr:unnamed protein product [Taenia asiatica]
MFPSAANIRLEEQSKDTTPKSDSWLQSSSYRPQNSSDPQLQKAHQEDEKYRLKKHRKRSRSPQVEKQTISAPEIYRIDTTSNRYIYKCGCIYEGDVAKFRQSLRTPILGFNGTLCNLRLDPEAIKREMKRNRANRYFSKRNRLRIAQTATPVVGPTKHADDSLTPYLVLQGGAVPFTAEAPISRPSERLQSVADLNRVVYDAPSDLKSWLKLIQMQVLEEETEGDSQEPSKHHRFLILERQLAIVERAVGKNPGNLRLRLLLTAMYEYSTELIASGVCRTTTSSTNMPVSPQQRDRVLREWYDLVRVCPQFVSVWRGYLAHLRGCFALFGANSEAGATGAFKHTDALYRRALETLSGLIAGRILSHRPTEDTADQTVGKASTVTTCKLIRWYFLTDLLAEYCQWLSQTGFTERAFSIWQAVIEFACFCPSHLQSRDLASSAERRSEFQRFWTAEDRGAVFGVPGARGWAAWCFGERQVREKPIEEVASSDGLLMRELEEDWGPSSSTAGVLWNRLIKDWNDVSEAAEDALLNSSNLSCCDTDAALANTTISRTYQSGEGSLSSRRSRGLAWLGLERARECVGWLPANTTMFDPSIVEDADRQPRFEDIEPFLLEVHLDPRVSDEKVFECRKQRLILLFLEFLGIWDADVAREYKLPAELQQIYELSSVSCLKRQSISPRQFGFPWLRSNLEAGSGGLDINFRMRSVLAASSLEQASRLFSSNATWQSTIGRLRFRHMADSIEWALADRLITPKEALALWRKKAKSLLSASSQAQSDLSLWLAYARGLVQTACALSENSSILFTEARKVFTTTLRMFSIPSSPATNATTTLEEQLNVILPRLRILHAFVEFELGVHFPLELARTLSRSECFARALHLIQHAAIGGAFAPLVENPSTPILRSALVNTADQLVQRLEMLRRLLPPNMDNNSSSYCVHSVADLAAILSSLLLYLQLLTSGEDKLKPICGLIFSVLLSIDNNGDNGSKRTKVEEGGGSSEGARAVLAGCGSRRFLRFALSAISAVSVLSQRNRARLTESFLDLMSDFFTDDALPLLTSPLEWTHLLPFKVAANCGAYVSKTCSIEYQRSLQGLLPPLILTALESRLTDCVRGVCCSVARHLTATCHHATMRPRTRFEGGTKEDEGISDPTHLLGLPSEQQTELMARLLPSSLDLLVVGLELEHWTSIVAGAADNCVFLDFRVLLFYFCLKQIHRWPFLIHLSSFKQGAVPRIRSVFEKALGAFSSSSSPMLRFGGTSGEMPCLALTMTPSFWTDHLRIILWSAYMAFEWTLAGVSASSTSTPSASDFDAHRKQRSAFKAIFYRAVDDLPWAKVLYTDLARYCPEDAEEVVRLLTSKELRLRTFMEEVDLLLTSKLP